MFGIWLRENFFFESLGKNCGAISKNKVTVRKINKEKLHLFLVLSDLEQELKIWQENSFQVSAVPFAASENLFRFGLAVHFGKNAICTCSQDTFS